VNAPLLEVRNLAKRFDVRKGGAFGFGRKSVRAVDGVSFSLQPGETVGLVGESGCGKSTLARSILFLETPDEGEIIFGSQPLSAERVYDLRRRAQIVFQDPYSSLPPRMKIKSIVGDPLEIHGIAKGRALDERVAHLLIDVGLKADDANRFPYELSGGQRQRVGIARALAVQPSLVIADESVSSLDVSVQAQILNLFKDLQERHHLAYLFVSHDLGVVKYMSHRILVMYLGQIVELAPADEIHNRPLHPYTRALLSAIPSIHARRERRVQLHGEPPDPSNPPSGCKFHPRCPIAQAICREVAPELKEWIPGHKAACHFALDVAEDTGRSVHHSTMEMKP
jgi:oligopeptide/dipeptide ABC transporter ATP-binding protein